MKQLLIAIALLFLPTVALAEGLPGISGEYPIFKLWPAVVADSTVQAVPGYVDLLVCIGTDNSATAGTIALLDHTTVGGGTTVISWTVQTTYNYATPVIFPVRRAFTAGIVLDYTNAGNVSCYVTYR